jgi:hypothetical protein
VKGVVSAKRELKRSKCQNFNLYFLSDNNLGKQNYVPPQIPPGLVIHRQNCTGDN